MGTIGTLGGAAGAAVGGAYGGPAGAQIGQNIGQATGDTVEPLFEQLSPAAKAQRKMFKDAAKRMRTGAYGMSEAQKTQAAVPGNQQLAAQQAQANDALARGVAGGGIAGGAASMARNQAQQAAAAGAAQVAGQVQQASSAAAQAQNAQDQAVIDAQAARSLEFWRNDAAKPNVDVAGLATKAPINMNDPNNPFNAQPGKSTQATTAAR